MAHLISAGDAANASRRWAEASDCYAAALDIDPARGAIWVQYGHALKERGYLQRAEDAYRKALVLDDAAADTHLQLGHVLKLQGRLDAAVSAYWTSYLRDPAAAHSRVELEAAGVRLPAMDLDGVRGDAAMPWLEAPGGAGTAPALPGAAGRTSPAFHDLPSIKAADDARRAGAGAGAEHDSLEQLLGSHGLGAEFLYMFDANYYCYVNAEARQAVREPSQKRCLAHFCTSGIEGLLTIGEGLHFDPDFYMQNYLRHLSFTDSNAYRHWLSVGIKQGCAPNRQWWGRKTFGRELTGVDRLDIALAAAAIDRSILKEGWTAQVRWFGSGAVADPRLELAVSAETADTLTVFADRLAVEQRDAEAFGLYQRILLNVPAHRQAKAHYADALLRRDCFLEAKGLYERLVDDGAGTSIWHFINLAKCQERLGDREDALQTLRRGMDILPGDLGLRRRFDELARAYFANEWDMAAAQGRLGRFDQAQERIRTACHKVAALIRTTESSPPQPISSIALFVNQDLPQCRFYRVDQKVEQIQMAGYKVTVYDFHTRVPDFLADLSLHQAAIFYRVPAQYDVIVAILKARELGIATLYEIDDLIFDAQAYPGSLASYGGQIGEEEYIGLKLGVPLFEHAMSLCEFGIASTPALAQQMRGRVESGTVFVHRNAFGKKHASHAAAPQAKPPNERMTIFYGSGTKAHKEDFQELVEPALVEVVRKHGDRVSIVLTGYVSMTDRLRGIADNITFMEPIWDIDRYWAMLREVDINLAVLNPSLMADCKSEIKWLEAAMFAIPSVVSGTATYREVIEDGVTGLVCDTPADWTAGLDRLVADRHLRQRIGQEARRRACRDYGMETMAGSLQRIFAKVGPPAAQPRKPVILVVNVFYPPQSIGGATRVVHDNVRNLSQTYGDQFRIEVFTSIEGGLVPYEIRSHVQDGVRVTGVTTPDDAEVERKVEDARMHAIFGCLLDHVEPALVHFHCIQRLTASVVAAARERGIPYVVSAHDGWWISDHQFLLDAAGSVRLYDYANPLATARGLGQQAFDRLMAIKAALTGAARVLAVSAAFAEVYRSCGVPNVITVANGMSPLAIPERHPSEDGRVRLGFVGGLSTHKGYDLIKYALQGHRFNSLRLIAIDHAMAPGTSRTEVWNSTPVEFRAKVEQAQVGRLYGEIDVLLAPSVWPESYGLVAREALHCGCWVVASDRGSIGEYVADDVNGYVVDASNPSQLTSVLHRIDAQPARFIASPQARPAMRQASEQAGELAELYAALLAMSVHET